MGRLSGALATAHILGEAFGDEPFTAGHALSIDGVTAERLRAAVGAGALIRLRRGSYVVSATSDAAVNAHQRVLDVALDRAKAGALTLPGSVVSHGSAAVLHGLPLAQGLGRQPTITYPGTRPRVSQGLRIHMSPLLDEHIMMVDGVPVTTPARTVVDLARQLDTPRALVSVDAALRQFIDQSAPLGSDLRRLVHDASQRSDALSELARVVNSQAGWPGIRRARTTIALGDPAAESPLESESRGVLVLRGVPTPVVGAPVVGANGTTYWADMLWEAHGVIGECDGEMKYSDTAALIKEKRRQEELEQAGSRFVRWMYPDLREPWRLVGRVNRALGLC